MISVPPTNSFSTYNCGIVGHSEYSLIPIFLNTAHISYKPQHTVPQILVFEHIERGEFLGIDALQAENLETCAREAALRRFGRAFHEKHDGRRCDCLVYRGARFC